MASAVRMAALMLLVFSFLTNLSSAVVTGTQVQYNDLRFWCNGGLPESTYYHSDLNWLRMRSDMDGQYESAPNTWNSISQNQIIELDPPYSVNLGVVASPYAIYGSLGGYLHHPNVAWYPDDIYFQECVGPWTCGIYSAGMASLCYVKDDFRDAIEAWAKNIASFGHNTVVGPTNFNPDGYPACNPFLDVYGNSIPNSPPLYWCYWYNWRTSLVCKGKATIWETSNSPAVKVGEVDIDNDGSLSQVNLPRFTQLTSIPAGQDELVVHLRTDINLEWCALYTRELNNDDNMKFVRNIYSPYGAPDPTIQGNVITFTLRKKVGPECKLSIDGNENPQVNCDNPLSVTLDYKNLFTADQNARIDCDSQPPAEYIFNQLSGTSTGYPGGTKPPVSGSCTLTGAGPHTVTGYVKSGANLIPCPMTVSCTSGPSCSLSVVGDASAECDPHTFDIRLEYHNIGPGDFVVITAPNANPAGYTLSKGNLDNCPPGDPYCEGPFTYSAPGTYQITGYIDLLGLGGDDTIPCTSTSVHCLAPGELPCIDYI